MDQTPRTSPPATDKIETKLNGSESQITEKSVPELENSDKELRDFIEHAAVAMHWVAADGTILWANQAELKLLGYDREEYVGHSITEFHIDQAVIGDILLRLKRDETLHSYEARVRCKDGSIRYVSISSSVYREDGQFVHTRCITLDVTGKKEAAELYERLAAIVASSDDAIISKSLDGIILSWNRGAERIFGYTAEEVIGKDVSMLAAPDCVDEIPAILARISRGDSIDHYETKRKTKDGRILTVALTVSPIKDSTGTVIAASNVARDVTEQRRLSEIQERLAAIVESSDDAIISKDLNGIVRSWNRGAERLFGYASAEVVGKPITIIIPPDRLHEEPEILGRLERGERVDHFETIRRSKDGALLNVSLTISPVRNAQGKIVGASKIARDITGRRRAEASIKSLNEQLSAELKAMTRMQQTSTRLVEAQDFNQLLEEIVAAGTEITGADMGNIQLLEDGALKIVAQRGFETPFLEFLDDAGHGLAPFATALQRGERVIVEDVAESPFFIGTPECAVMLAAGVRAVQVTPLVSRSGRVLGLFSTHYRAPGRPGDRELRMLDLLARQAADLIERRQSEAEVAASEARFRQLADSMPQIVWTARPDGYIDYYNERWYEFTGFSRASFGDMSWEPVLHPDDLNRCRENWHSCVSTGEPYRIEYRFWDRHESRWRWFMGRALPVRDSRGKIVKWFGSCTDIDDQKRTEEDLRRANQDLEQFAYSASHDLQEPLRMVSTYSEMLKRDFGGKLGQNGDEYLGYTIQGALRMEHLLRDLRAYTLVSGTAQQAAEDVDADRTLDTALAALESAIKESHATITRTALPSVRMHEFQLEQLFQNLIANAIRYRSSEELRIHIGAERRDKEWLFFVRDNGIGIDPQYKEQIFEIFKRLHSAAAYPGTGMGLAICQRIVERAGGNIWVESELGRGSTFFFTVPRSAGPADCG